MDDIEKLRNQLHLAMDTGNKKRILALSRKLDKLILEYIKRKIDEKREKSLWKCW
ncbi:MAG: aspartyl-phosphate phosphatase Spo0E family protein [Bacillota bacterium]